MDKLTRKDLKSDRFAQEVTHSIEYVQEHGKQAKLYGGIAAAVLVVAAGGYWITGARQAARQSDLAAALRNMEGVVGPKAQPGDTRPVFVSEEDKRQKVQKGFQDFAARHGGSNEAAIARYHLGIQAAEAGKFDEALKHFQSAVSEGGQDISSVAKLALADVHSAQNRPAEAEKLYRELMANPTALVSKEQSTLSLARMIGQSKPAEARKLIEPLQKDERVAVARNAVALLSELPLK